MTDFERLEGSTAQEIIGWAVKNFGANFAIASSFQKEDMVMLDMASRAGGAFRLFTLDTGRLHDETYQMMETVRQRYGITVEAVFPDWREVERMTAEHGPNLFYGSVAARKMCCEMRKVKPLERKLKEFRAWATGLRREQTEARAHIPKIRESDGRIKLSPLADWSGSQVEEYIQLHEVPLHPLYARGYTSIGCAPCTRAVAPGESERAGRWWWEQGGPRECGIHFAADGKVVRGA